MRAALGIVWLAAALGCQGAPVNEKADLAAPLRAIPREKLRKLAGKRVYFGHQSVGMNVFEGLEALGRDDPDLRLEHVDARKPGAYARPAFGHAPIGRNEDPLSKIRAFADALEGGGVGAKVDVALFKFCYVDFPPGTDVEKIFAEYESTLARLRREFPKVKFVHVTAPLTVIQSGPKAFVKRIIGRRLGGAEANVVRERFNQLLRGAYAGREPIFDLAAAESTMPDGRAVRFEDGGKDYPALAPSYASDGKHLNGAGSRWAAAHLLATLAAAAE